MTNLVELNLALAKALGVEDMKNVFRIGLVIDPQNLPTLIVSRRILSVDGLEVVNQHWHLVPIAAQPTEQEA